MTTAVDAADQGATAGSATAESTVSWASIQGMLRDEGTDLRGSHNRTVYCCHLAAQLYK